MDRTGHNNKQQEDEIERKKKQNEAATKIQARVRGIQGRAAVEEMRELHRKVVEGMIAVAADRKKQTGQGLQETGAGDRPLEGEEVDW